VLDDQGAHAYPQIGVPVKGAISAIGLIVLFVVLFWIIGIVAVPGASGAAAVGDGIRATIEFFATALRSI
jgi:hypothetical protein